MPAAHSEPPTVTPPEADGGLRCPHCDYNLTGLNENRCPECGNSFEPEELRNRLAYITPSPIRGWDDGLHSWPVAFVWMCLLTWFAPWRVGSAFPQCYCRRSAAVFRWAALLIAMGLALALGWLVNRSSPHAIIELLPLVGGWTVGVFLCEALITAQLWVLLATDKASRCERSASTSWCGLVGFYRSFMMLMPMAVALGLLGGGTPGPFIILLLWWWISLAVGVGFRGGPRLERSVGMILIVPVAVVVTVTAFYFVGQVVLFIGPQLIF